MILLIIGSIFLIFLTIGICLTYKIRNTALRWSLIVIPPLFIIPLYWVPWDMATCLFWFLAIIAFLLSIISISIRTITIIVRAIAHKHQSAMAKIKFIRPALTLLIFSLVAISVRLSLISADEFGIETAKRIKSVADANGICPKKLEGWEPDFRDANDSIMFYGKYGTKYPIKYTPSKDLKEFTIKVRHHIDYALFIYGGVNVPLTTDRYIDEDEWVKVPIEEIECKKGKIRH